jgi:hypothetical protein
MIAESVPGGHYILVRNPRYYLISAGLLLYQRLNNYMIGTAPTSPTFEAMYFDFHNQVLASHLEVRQAMAIDHQALIKAIPGRLATPLCTDHGLPSRL